MIKKVLEASLNVDWDNTDEVCNFYESESAFFNDCDKLERDEDILDVIHIKVHYIEHLIVRKQYHDALAIVKDVDELLERVKDESKHYHQLKIDNLFHKGVLYGFLKLYSDCLVIFEELLTIDGNNELYQNWYSHTKQNIRHKKLRIVSNVGLIVIFGHVGLDLLCGVRLHQMIIVLGYVMVLTGWLLPKILGWIERKQG